MSDFHYVELYAKFAGFCLMAMANRLGCDDEFSRGAHDRLVERLDQLVDLVRGALAAERELALAPSGPEADDLGERIWCAGQELTHYWGEPDGIDLLLNDVHVDWSTNEWYDSRAGRWHFLADFPAPREEVGDDRLHGLCAITRQIAAETGIYFNTFTTDLSIEGEEPDDERERYEAIDGLVW